MRKSPYVSRLLPLHQWKKATVDCHAHNLQLPFSTDEEAAASKHMRLLRRYFRACRHDDTSSLRLFKVERSGLQIMKYFSHKHRLHRSETGLKEAACFKTFQLI